MVETYLIEEAEKLIAEPAEQDQWGELVATLGLEGQTRLKGTSLSPIPFPALSLIEFRVYDQLCPRTATVQEYDRDTIPLRVLSLIALADKEKYFKGVEIWYEPATADPIALGYTVEKSYRTADKKYFIIARWGDQLRSMPELTQMAIKKYLAKKSAEYNEAIANAKYKLDKIKYTAEQFFQVGKEWVDD